MLDPRPEFYRAVVRMGEEEWEATGTGGQISSRLLNVASSNVLLVLPPSSEPQRTLRKDSHVQAIFI